MPMPLDMEYPKSITMNVMNATIASAASSQSTLMTEPIMRTPTQMRAVAVAQRGMSWAMGERNMAIIKHMPVTSEVKPVLPPATTPDEDSTKVVTVEVPAMAPVQVAIASASIIFSMRMGGRAVFIEKVALGTCAVERADGIEHIYHAQGQGGSYEHDDERTDVVVAGIKVCVEVETFVEHCARGILSPRNKRIEGIGDGYVGEDCLSRSDVCSISDCKQYVIEHGGTENTPEYCALNILFRENDNSKYADNGDYCGEHTAHVAANVGHERGVFIEDVETYKARQRAAVVDDYARLLHAYEGDKHAYTHGYGMTNARGNGLEYALPQTRNRQDEEYYAVEKGKHHAVCICKPRCVVAAADERKDYERIDTHTRSLGKGHFGEQRH